MIKEYLGSFQHYVRPDSGAQAISLARCACGRLVVGMARVGARVGEVFSFFFLVGIDSSGSLWRKEA